MGSTETSTATVAAPAARRRKWLTIIYYTGRACATAGVVTLALAAWMPFLWVNGYTGFGNTATTYSLELSAVRLDIPLTTFEWSFLSVIGLFLLPLVWSDQRPLLSFAAWFLYADISGMYVVRSDGFPSPDAINVALGPDHHLTWLRLIAPTKHLIGYWLSVGASLLSVLGTLYLLPLIAARSRDTGLRGRLLTREMRGACWRRRPHLPGAGAFTLGVVMLLASVFAVGWAADNCTASPLLVGSCTGLTFNGVEYYGIQAHTDLFDPIASLHAIPLFIVLGAGLILLALWAWRRITPGLCLWITLWLAAVTFFVIVAIAGVGTVTEHAADLGLQAGTWKGQSGAYLAGAGLFVGWLALASLWYAALRGDRVGQMLAASPDDGTERR